MKRSVVCGVLLLAGFAAAAPPASPQDLSWAQRRGYDVPYVPTPHEVVEGMLVLAGVKPGDVLYDLGCGDGRIVIAAAKKFGIRATGIDIDPIRIAESNKNAAAAGVADKVRFVQQDLFQSDFHDATVVTMYLLTSVNLRLRPKLLAELKPGTRLVSHSFEMGEWLPDKTVVVTTNFGDERDIHFWVVPANVTGRWEWDAANGSGPERYVFEAGQEFETVTLSGRRGGSPLSISDVKLVGGDLSFRLTEEAGGNPVSKLYEGKVTGDTISGTIRPAGNPKGKAVPWHAARDPKTAVTIAK